MPTQLEKQMFVVFLLGFLFVAALTSLVIGKRLSKREYSEVPSWAPRAVSGGLFVVFLAVFGFSSIYRLDPGDAVVLKSWSGMVQEDAVYSENGGIHFKMPWVKATNFSVRNQQVVFQAEDGDDINISASTKDNASVYFDLTFNYNQSPSKVVGIYKAYRTEVEMRTQLMRDARSAVQAPPTTFLTMDIKQKRGDLEVKLSDSLKAKLEAKYGIEVTSVSLRSMWFTDEVQASLDAVQARNAGVEQARADLERAKLTAEVTRTDAQAQADADQIIRCGAETKKVKQVINGIEQEVTQTVPLQGERCQDRLNEQVLMAKYIDALREMAAKGNLIVVPEGFSGMLNMPTKQ